MGTVATLVAVFFKKHKPSHLLHGRLMMDLVGVSFFGSRITVDGNFVFGDW